VKQHLVNYISYINNILVKVKLVQLIELKVVGTGSGGGGSDGIGCSSPFMEALPPRST
jgi:hypothetical protein